MAVTRTEGYSPNQLRILWMLKRADGVIADRNPKPKTGTGLLEMIAGQLNIRKSTVASVLRQLEQRSLVLRTYQRPPKFGDNQGPNLMVKLELVDPSMYLPPLPPPLPLVAVVEHENKELYARTERVPTAEAIVEALLARIGELQGQVDKLQDIVQQQADQLSKERKREKEVGDSLTSRVRDALPSEVWDRLSHP